MATHPRQAERESNETGQDTTRKMAEQAASTGRSFAEAGERTARAGAEAMQRNADAVGETWRNGSEVASRMAGRSLDQLSKMLGMSGETARQTAQQSANNIQALMESTTIVAGGLHDASAEWLRFAQGRVEQNLDHFDQLMGCRSPQEYFALQTRIVRDAFEALLHSARRSAERATHIVDEASRKISDSTLAPR